MITVVTASVTVI